MCIHALYIIGNIVHFENLYQFSISFQRECLTSKIEVILPFGADFEHIWHAVDVRLQMWNSVCNSVKINKHEKVLLRKRERHIARRVASARCAALSPRGGVIPTLDGETYPGKWVPTLDGGYLPWVGVLILDGSSTLGKYPYDQDRYPPLAGR